MGTWSNIIIEKRLIVSEDLLPSLILEQFIRTIFSQVDGVQDLAAVAGAVPAVEHGEEWNETLDTPDVE